MSRKSEDARQLQSERRATDRTATLTRHAQRATKRHFGGAI